MENQNVIDVDFIQEKEHQFKKIMLMYRSALKEIQTKVDIISDEFQMLYKYNPIEHVKTRIKSPESIIKKLKKKGYPLTYSSLVDNLHDVAGIRIICSFIPDIYKMVEMFDRSTDINIIEKKDYIQKPKESGYSSYHLIALVPVSFSSGVINVKVEIQIRTIAMDFWASLEHKIKYKYPEELPKNIVRELKECSKMVNKLDKKMSKFGTKIIEELQEDMVSTKNMKNTEVKVLNTKTEEVLTQIIEEIE